MVGGDCIPIFRIYILLHPLWAVLIRDAPYKRIIHNYSRQFNGVPLNDCLIDNSNEYMNFKDRVELFKTVNFYAKLDLRDGY